MAVKYNQILEEGKVYAMSGGNVKLANKRFTTIPHDHSITFDEGSKFEFLNCQDISGEGFNFKKLSEVQESVNLFMIDLIAVVTEVQPPGQITVKSTGEQRDKRTITLSDDSGIGIDATIWGDDS